MRRAAAWATDYEFDKIGKEVDRSEWLMTPQTVNAYYHPRMNEIVFPAAILQPPFFDPDADDAANYGGIGAVIGHEIGHGFDDQGSRYDGDGNMTDWWTREDRAEFDRRAQQLIEQYSALSPLGLPGHKVNGALTVGENIGDLGGLTIAIKAYRIALGGAEAPELDGLTGLQRVLFGWAQVWRAATRDAEAVRRLAIDPHSPPDLRCNAVVTNLDAFHEAFGGAGDGCAVHAAGAPGAHLVGSARPARSRDGRLRAVEHPCSVRPDRATILVHHPKCIRSRSVCRLGRRRGEHVG